VKSGFILWEYKANLDQKINTVCCGWLSRGVALGDGRVYLGQLDGRLVALDQRTGKVVWSTDVGSWQRGYTITNAPLYYDGLVITGVSGGEFSIRGRVQAYDAKTGKEVWRFYTIPGPGEVGHDSWPQGTNAWEHGGAPVWQTPAVDPELGLLYFSTGNASPDLDGSRRAGDNLFAASIVAVDAKTGTYRWHFQQVHHDIWDYDGPSPVVLFDVDVDGTTRHALAQSSKTGWIYILDRKTGKPIFPIDEKPVPQLLAQKTAPTQPIPSYPPYIAHEVSDAAYDQVAKLARANAKGKQPKITRAQEMYTPFGTDVTVITPGPQGGNNWQPMSFNQKTHMLYVCAQSGTSGYTRSGRFLPEGKQGQVADIGSVLTLSGFGNQPGHFLAIDATTGRVVWRHRWPEACYAGTATTAGGVTFVGRSDGRLQAYDAGNGKQLWSFQTGAGANDAPTFFEQDGKEYMVFYAGGNSLAASPHGDNLWLFSLDGTLEPAQGTGPGQGAGHAGEAPPEPTNQGGANAAAGESVWADNCSSCHGLNGQGGNGGPDLTSIESAKNLQRVIAQVTNGGGGMPAFKGTLSDAQIRSVAAYVVQRITNGR
jgi:quinohemoprotein ethanol dehydrogenase